MSGRWIVAQDFFGTLRYMRLQLEQNGVSQEPRFVSERVASTGIETVNMIRKGRVSSSGWSAAEG